MTITKAAGAAAQAWSQIIVPNLTVCMTVPVAAVVYIGSCQGPQTSTVATVVHLSTYSTVHAPCQPVLLEVWTAPLP